MDKQVEALIRSYKIIKGKDVKKGFALTEKEEKKYGKIEMDDLRNQLHAIEPGEAPRIELLNTEDDKIVYEISHGRRTRSLKELGYELKDEVWRKKFKKEY